MKGQILSGEFGQILIRQKSGADIELGELLVSDSRNGRMLFQVYDLLYGSQISQQNLELISGMNLEEDSDLEFMDPNLRNYTLARLKNLATISSGKVRTSKALPDFFSGVRQVTSKDFSFLGKPSNSLYLGKLRSGSSTLPVDIFLDGAKLFSHHILIPASTGKGKSNLVSCILWDSVDKDYCGILILDPHDEYYGRTKKGLKDHPSREKVSYYSPNPPPGSRTLKINLKVIRPHHFNGVIDWSDPQREAMAAYYKVYKEDWISAIVLSREINNFYEGTIAVVRRRMLSLLSLDVANDSLYSKGIFDVNAGMSTVREIVNDLEDSKKVIIDTSSFSGSVEILIGSIISSELFNCYRKHAVSGKINDMPVISIVLEEAPRVLGKNVLEKGHNIFSTIAREGRKFKVGLLAVTQLPSLIPREILANMNTKIILGTEMAPERQAIIESASQDLSDFSRSIASLDIGEALVTSTFTPFAMPIIIPLFDDIANASSPAEHKKDYSGIKL